MAESEPKSKRPRGRPPLPVDVKKSTTFSLHLAAQERADLLAAALLAGLPIGELVRRRLGLVRGDAGAAPATRRAS
ncbi:MAG TPA: hypothetical protein VH560_18695 [Polyangia bacterium]|jgi:hypothetical protein|nr:hypothetical protein [Polyangia bacterium]